MKTEIEKRASKFIDETDMMQFSTMEIMVMFAEKELAAINYTRCCEMLKVEEKLTFSKWLEANKYEYRHNNLYRQESNKLLTHVDLLGKEYIKYFNL